MSAEDPGVSRHRIAWVKIIPRLRTDLGDTSAELMAHGLRDLLDEHSLIINMKIRSADTCPGNPDEDLVRRTLRLLYLFESDIVNSVKSC